MIRISARKNLLPVFAALVAAAAIAAGALAPHAAAEDAARVAAAHDKNWEAVAPGLIEPRSGEIKIVAPVIERISEVFVKANDKVFADEPLVRLDDGEARARVASAKAQIAMRRRARNDQAAGKAADRRKAEDAVAEAENSFFESRQAFDKAAIAAHAGNGADDDLEKARTDMSKARDTLNQQRAQLHKIETNSGTPLPTQGEGSLNVARTDLRLAVIQLEKLTIRAPADSTVLQVNAKVGELASPSAPAPLVLLGDLSQLRVRAELDERDVGDIKLGHKVVVRTDAFRGREFTGTVSAVAPIVQAGRINSPGSRNLTDFSVAEVFIDLDDPGPLVVGMKVDVYFQPDVVQ